MNKQIFNNYFTASSYSNRDVLSVFKQRIDKPNEIQKGMSIEEISEIVSDKVLEIVKAQFQLTKNQFHSKKNK